MGFLGAFLVDFDLDVKLRHMLLHVVPNSFKFFFDLEFFRENFRLRIFFELKTISSTFSVKSLSYEVVLTIVLRQ